MEIRLLVIDEERNTIGIVGFFSALDMQKIIEYAEENNLFCLQFISLTFDTHFNERQQHLIVKDLEVLRKQDDLNKDILKMIADGLLIAKTDSFSQLKFEPMHAQKM